MVEYKALRLPGLGLVLKETKDINPLRAHRKPGAHQSAQESLLSRQKSSPASSVAPQSRPAQAKSQWKAPDMKMGGRNLEGVTATKGRRITNTTTQSPGCSTGREASSREMGSTNLQNSSTSGRKALLGLSEAPYLISTKGMCPRSIRIKHGGKPTGSGEAASRPGRARRKPLMASMTRRIVRLPSS